MINYNKLIKLTQYNTNNHDNPDIAHMIDIHSYDNPGNHVCVGGVVGVNNLKPGYTIHGDFEDLSSYYKAINAQFNRFKKETETKLQNLTEEEQILQKKYKLRAYEATVDKVYIYKERNGKRKRERERERDAHKWVHVLFVRDMI